VALLRKANIEEDTINIVGAVINRPFNFDETNRRPLPDVARGYYKEQD